MRRLAPAVALALLLAHPAHAGVLLGEAAPADAPRLDRKALPSKGRLLLVLDTPYEIWSGQGTYVHLAAFLPDFRPAAGAAVFVGTRQVGKTDAHGTLAFSTTPRGGDDGAGRSLTVVYTDPATQAQEAGRLSFESYARTESFESAQLYVYTDRGVYNPGQTVLVRAIAWRLRGDYAPLAGQKVELSLIDGSGKLAVGRRVETGAFGTAGASFPLPERMPEGRYKLRVGHGGAVAEADLRVERIVPPVIEIKHNLKRYLARAQATLPFEVTLASFTGQPPRRGTLVVRATGGKAAPPWDDKRTLDSAPSYRFEIPEGALLALKQATPDGQSLEVTITATDETGRSDTLRRALTVRQNPYTAVLEADKDEYVRSETAKLQLKLVDLDGLPVKQKSVRLEVAGGKAPQPKRTDDSGVASFDLVMSREGLEVAAYLEDVAAPVASTYLPVIEAKPMLSKVHTPLVRERRKVSIEVKLERGYTPVEAVVHGDVVDSSGALVGAFLLPLVPEGKHWAARGSFTAPAWGTMLVTLFCVAKRGSEPPSSYNVGLLTEGQQVTVLPNKELKVSLGGLPATARPGARLGLSFEVRDPLGKASDAQLGVSLVDAAVLSLLDPLEVNPKERFYNPELKVLATTGSKILTWPVVQRNWGENQYDIALPPFGFHEGGRAGGYAGGNDDYGGVGTGGIGSGGSGYGYGSAMGSLGGQSYPKSAPPAVKSKNAADLEAPQAEPSMSQPQAERSVAAPPPPPPASPGRPAPAPPAPAQITIRTRFPETALWLDDVSTSGGKAKLEVLLPDSITRQAITVVATDKKGGIGVLRQDLTVTQPVFARADLPASLVVGDEVEVRAAVQNNSQAPIEAELSLRSAGLEVLGAAAQRLTVPAQSAVGASFRVKAARLGKASYAVQVRAPGIEDTEERTLAVVPAGSSELSPVARGRAGAGQSFNAELEATAQTAAALRLVLPGAAAPVELFEELSQDSGFLLEAPGVRGATAAYLLMHLERTRTASAARLSALRAIIAEDLLLLSMTRGADGSFAFLRTGRGSPYLTGRALETAFLARKLEFMVPDEVVLAAARYVLRSVDDKGFLAVDDVAWWEGSGPDRRLALTADLFRVLAEAGPSAVPDDVRPSFDRMRLAVEAALKASSDPLTLAHAGLGLRAYQEKFARQPMGAEQAGGLVERLLHARRRGHWEPSWFNAGGGTLETTAAVLELLLALDPAQAQPIAMEVMGGLFEARRLYGRWHSGVGSVFVARALLALPAERESKATTLRVEVNGRSVVTRAVDPKDPVEAALELARIELTPHLLPGKNTVAVHYDGAAAPWVTLEASADVPPATTGLVAKRTIKAGELRVGESAEVVLELAGAVPDGGLWLAEPLASTTSVDPASLEALKQRGIITSFELGQALVVHVAPATRGATLSYRLMATRPGTATLRPAVAWQAQRPEDRRALAGVTTVRVVP